MNRVIPDKDQIIRPRRVSCGYDTCKMTTLDNFGLRMESTQQTNEAEELLHSAVEEIETCSQAAVAVEGERIGQCGDPCGDGNFWCGGRFDAAQTDSLALQPGQISPAVARVRGDWHCAEPDVTDEFRAKLVQDLKEFRGGPDRCGSARVAGTSCLLHDRRICRHQHLPAAKGSSSESGYDHSTQGNFFYYLATAPDFFGRSWSNWRRPANVGGESSLASRNRREAVWAGSGFSQSTEPTATQSGP